MSKPGPALSNLSSVVIALYGDSTMWGTTLVNGVYTQSPDNEPALLQIAFNTSFPGRVAVLNRAVPGSTCPELLYGQPPIAQPWAVEMASSPAQIVAWNQEINDAFIPGYTDADEIYCESQLVAIARTYGKTVLIMSGNPINDSHNSIMWSLTHDILYVGQQLQVPVIDQWDTILNWYPDWQADLPDNIHPDARLYTYKAGVSYNILEPIVAGAL
jgi:hypothetical protein